MRLSAIVVSALAAAAHATPVLSRATDSGSIWQIIEVLAAIRNGTDKAGWGHQKARVESSAGTSWPGCDFSKARMPLNGLPAPAAGLAVRHVAVGRGTQNYTCDAGNVDAVPQAVGAVATLFNVSCLAVTVPAVAGMMPAVMVQMDLETARAAAARVAPESGVHYFRDPTTPFFDLDTPEMYIGRVPSAKNSAVAAPPSPFAGLGPPAVPWLKLTAKEGATGGIREIYRVDTARGSAPSSCQGQPAAFEVQYSAVYWFWGL